MWSMFSQKNEEIKSKVLILGKRNTGKTSLAFHMAYETASMGSNVLYVAMKSKMESKLPLMVTDINRKSSSSSSSAVLTTTMSPGVLSRINMKYVSNASEFKLLCASLHGFSPRPSCIIVDDLTTIIDPLSSVSRHDRSFLELATLSVAYLDDAVKFLENKVTASSRQQHTGNNNNKRIRFDSGEADCQVRVVISADCFDDAFIHSMFRYLDCALLLHRTTETGAMPGSAVGSYDAHSHDINSNTAIASRQTPSALINASTAVTNGTGTGRGRGGSDDADDVNEVDSIVRLSEGTGSLRTCSEVVRMGIRWKYPPCINPPTDRAHRGEEVEGADRYDRVLLKNERLFLFSSNSSSVSTIGSNAWSCSR